MKIDCKYIRKGSKITDANTGALVGDHKTINQAKKHSRKLQGDGAQLGWGAVRVVRS